MRIKIGTSNPSVMPEIFGRASTLLRWIPACAGMTRAALNYDRLIVIAASFLVLTLLVGRLFAADTLELVIPLPLTGSESKFGEIEKRSYEIAAEEINAKGGIKGKKVALSFEDSRGKPEISRAIVEKLIDVRKQPVIFGEYSSSCSKAVASVANEKRVPYLVVTAAADEITQRKHKYVFRMNPANNYYAAGLISFLKEVVKPKSIAILYESSDFGTSGAAAMVRQAEKIGLKVVTKEKYEKGAVDFKAILSKVKAARPDVIYMISYAFDAPLLMKQIRESDIDARLFAGGAAGFAIPEFVRNAGDAAEYVTTAALWSPQAKYPGARDYAEKYKKLYGDYPSYHGAEAYSALYIIKDVLQRAKSLSAEDVRAAMKATVMITAFGPVKFEDKDGYQNQNFMETIVMQVIKGRHETIWPEKYASKKYIYPIPLWKERRS